MDDLKVVSQLRYELFNELTSDILPYWMKLADPEYGGFYGQVDISGNINKLADKGGILHARILWTFSSAYRITGNEDYLSVAQHAALFLQEKFIDNQFGGVYWKLDFKGNPVESKKQIYNLGFAVYALSEFHRATGDRIALENAIHLFKLIEKSSFDPVNKGYFEAFTREWDEIGDMRLSAKDANEKKTMNTHLHVLEAYTNLYRVWKSPHLKMQLINLIQIFTEKIIDNKTYHSGLFFDEFWHLKSETISYGHDIETAWLLKEAAEVTEDMKIITEITTMLCLVVDAALEGYKQCMGLAYEYVPSVSSADNERHWWVQAEAVVGCMEAYKISGNKKYLNTAIDMWQYIQNYIIDNQFGEWYWSRLENGEINQKQDKAGFWKCPYHNARMCMQIYEHFQKPV